MAILLDGPPGRDDEHPQVGLHRHLHRASSIRSENDPEIKAVVFARPGKKDSFIAGADITMLESDRKSQEDGARSSAARATW